jgi:hypothetical protein
MFISGKAINASAIILIQIILLPIQKAKAMVFLCWLPGKGIIKYTRSISAVNSSINPAGNKNRFIVLFVLNNGVSIVFYSVTGRGNSVQTWSPGLSIGSVPSKLYLLRSIHLRPSKKSEYRFWLSISLIRAEVEFEPL